MSDIVKVTLRWARCCVVALVGGTVVLAGIAMIVLPGPAIVVIPTGLAILGLEFAWAKHWLRKIKATSGSVLNSVRTRNARQRDSDINGIR